MEREWCDECGSGIWLKRSSDPSMTYLKAGKSNSWSLKRTVDENFLFGGFGNENCGT